MYSIFIFSTSDDGERFAKKQGAKNPGRGAEQSGYRPPANPNAVQSAQNPNQNHCRSVA